jgi:murein DD-endopeptidase MepM/ murein hydrolase activator NlpD
LLLLLLGFPLLLPGQERSALEEERKKILSGIQKLNTRLEQTRADKQELLESYALMRVQQERRQLLLDNLDRELVLADSLLAIVEDEICRVDTEIAGLDAAYGALARNAFRLRLNKHLRAFVLSAVSINDLLRRIRYLRTYEEYRKKQARLLLDKQQELSGLIEVRQQQRREKAIFLETIRDQKALMEEALAKQDLLVAQMQKSEKDLLLAIRQQESARKKLDGLIAGVIRTSSAKLPASGSVSSNRNIPFARAKGKLAWPVSEGMVLRKFGEQSHPTLKRVKIVNNGIDIESSGGQVVTGVFAGEVVGVQFVPGFEQTVIVRHDNFYTVYSNLSEVSVQRGTKVGAGAKLGTLAVQKPVLHFEIWRDKKRLDPLQWLGPEIKKQF